MIENDDDGGAERGGPGGEHQAASAICASDLRTQVMAMRLKAIWYMTGSGVCVFDEEECTASLYGVQQIRTEI